MRANYLRSVLRYPPEVGINKERETKLTHSLLIPYSYRSASIGSRFAAFHAG
jgi:hypothetical protein